MSIQEDPPEKEVKNIGCHQKTASADSPSQQDLEKEIGEYLSKRYGDRIRVVSHTFLPKELEREESGSWYKKTRNGQEIHFNLRPEELEAWLNRFVVRQESAKAILATKVCTHFNRIEYFKKRGRDGRLPGSVKNNIILIGPTGVGKTFLVRLMADHLGVPFVKGDATKFSETGYVGGDVEDLVRDLVREADGDIERASCGIIYIDEIDKIASSYHMQGPDISRSGVQRTLLKLLEETDIDLCVPHDPISQIESIERYRQTGKREKKTINTRNILFIVSGAFSGLSDVIKKRLSKQGIGFGADIEFKDDQYWLNFAKPQDLIEYGFESEFIGRFPVVAVLNELSVDDLYQILKNPDSAIIKSKKQDFKVYGIDLRFEDAALRLFADQAYQEHIGARALVGVLENALLPFEKRLPSTDIKFLVVTKDLVEDPEATLKDLLSRPNDTDFVYRYKEIVEAEKEELCVRIKESAAHIWQKAGMSLTPKRLDMISHLVVEEDMQLDMAQERLLYWIRQIKEYEDAFFNRSGITISFDEEAVDILLEGCLKDNKNLYTRCETLCNILEYGLTLIKERIGQTEFKIPGEAVEGAELYIKKLIRASHCSPSRREAM